MNEFDNSRDRDLKQLTEIDAWRREREFARADYLRQDLIDRGWQVQQSGDVVNVPPQSGVVWTSAQRCREWMEVGSIKAVRRWELKLL